MIAAGEASWLNGNDIVFGVAINGDVRAYPKRMLAWHEMFKNRIGGRELAGVYCTLCGALVLYEVTVGGVQHELGEPRKTTLIACSTYPTPSRCCDSR